MIKIKFDDPGTVSWKKWCADCRTAREKLENDVSNGLDCEITDLYKRKKIKKDVFFAKEGPFRGCCAYCESYLNDFQRGDIEHFRPKKFVTDSNDNPVLLVDSNGNKKEHCGYYWLAYEWTNLLPSCVICNQPTVIDGRKIGKHNRFPVEGSYAISAEGIADEIPLLINPTQDDPQEHIGVDLTTGLMNHRTARGDACIHTFGLNIRDQLVHERKKAMDEVKVKFDTIIHNPDEGAKIRAIRELDDIKSGKCAYAAAGREMLENLLRSMSPLFEK
jgi:uncharacterized protein (TIGR02646 family)